MRRDPDTLLDLVAHVANFCKGSVLRDAYATFWMARDNDFSDALTGKTSPKPGWHPRGPTPAWVKALRRAAPAKAHTCEAYGKNRPARRKLKPEPEGPKTVKVRIRLTYPLNEPHTRVVTIHTDRPGEVFGHAADLYLDIYKQDAKQGGGAHVCDNAPPGSKGSMLMNRDFGPLVWGHDLQDLVFEGIHFRNFRKTEKNTDGCVGEVSFDIGS